MVLKRFLLIVQTHLNDIETFKLVLHKSLSQR